MVGYANYLITIYMYMNINENFRNEREIVEKLRGVLIIGMMWHFPLCDLMTHKIAQLEEHIFS